MVDVPRTPKLAATFLLGALIGACQGDSNSTGLIDRGSCDVLIECAASLAPDARDEYEQVYGPGGSCWTNPSNWAACRDFCSSTLEALNLIAMATGQTCGACTSDADCGSFGVGSTCVAGLCSGGMGGQTEGETGDGTSETGDGDGDGDGDGCSSVPSVCQDLIACLAIALPQADTSMYDEGGSCWCGTPQFAQECTATCVEQLAAAAEAYPQIPACAGEVDPCPDGTEGCECDFSGLCKGQLLCDDFTSTCEQPVFGQCEVTEPFQDPFCPDAGCPNGHIYLDSDYDGVADFANCKWPCSEEFGLGQCGNLPGDQFLVGDPMCMATWPFGFVDTLACVNGCNGYSCPDGAVCIHDLCWYDLP